MYILLAILVFGILIAVHELGHFLVAKACGVRVDEFAIGMGPAIWKKQKGETLYAVRCLPIGGFCAMAGEDEAIDDPRAFTSQPAWKRFLILCAGAFMNFVFGLLLLLLVFAQAKSFSTPTLTDFMDGCPYQGDVPLRDVVRVATALHAMGCYEISLGDTIGIGTPAKARAMLSAVASEVPMAALAIHFHDTWGQALANVLACLEEGVTVVDAAVSGAGGCPYAKGASGNVASEDVVYMLHGLGIHTGIDLPKLADTGRWLARLLGRETGSKAGKAMAA